MEVGCQGQILGAGVHVVDPGSLLGWHVDNVIVSSINNSSACGDNISHSEV